MLAVSHPAGSSVAPASAVPASVVSESVVPAPVRIGACEDFRFVEQVYEAGTRIPFHSCVHSSLEITVRGNWQWSLRDRTLDCQSGSVCLSPPGMLRSRTAGPSGVSLLQIELAASISAQLRRYGIGMAFRSVHQGRPRWLAREVVRKWRSERSAIVLEGLILQLCAEMFRDPIPMAPASPSWLERADDILRERFRDSLTLAEIARHACVHPVHLARGYRRYRGSTVGERIRQLRLESARIQIETTNTPLAQIALACGFSDQSHLTVTFRNLYGTSPSAYRQLIQKREPLSRQSVVSKE